MKNFMEGLCIFIAFGGLFFLICWGMTLCDDALKEINQNAYNRISNSKETKQMLHYYFKAMENGDKVNALKYGRMYYARFGIFDEQRIQNDLLCYLQPQNKK